MITPAAPFLKKTYSNLKEVHILCMKYCCRSALHLHHTRRIYCKKWGDNISVSYSDMEVFVIARLDGPLKGHDGLTFAFIQGEEIVALLLVHQRHGVPRGVIILMDEKTKLSDSRYGPNIVLCLLLNMKNFNLRYVLIFKDIQVWRKHKTNCHTCSC